MIDAYGDAELFATTLCDIKHDLVCGKHDAQILDAIPLKSSSTFPAPQNDVDMLHKFMSENPIYHTSYDATLAGVQCVVYEGDINRYWLGSILHSSSRAPFSPTWIASAYVLTRFAKHLGYSDIIDVGSGDGRIAFCATVLGMHACGIEIDADLTKLQKSLACLSYFESHCSDVAEFDYTSLSSDCSVIFVGGLAQMGGRELASAVMTGLDGGIKEHDANAGGLQCVQSCDPSDECEDGALGGDVNAKKSVGWVFAGTKSPKYAYDPKGMHGWGSLMCENKMSHIHTIDLPTAWTLDHVDNTPYVFARYS